MNSKVLEIYSLLRKGEKLKACDQARALYLSQENTKDFEIVKVLAISYMLKPDHHLAYLSFKQAYSIKQDDFETITNLASLAFEVQNFQLSFDMAIKSIQMKPEQHMAYVTLANIHLISKELQLAESNILQAIKVLGGDLTKLFLSHEDIIILYLDILTALNEKNKIIEIIGKIKNNKSFFIGGLLHILNRIDKSAISSDDIDIAKNQINLLENSPSNNTTLLQKAHLNFNLGEYYLKENQQLSDEYFIKGNEIISSLQRFKPLEHQKRCIETINNFLKIKDFKVSNPNKGKGLIFVTGLPRSGTTLTESIIASNNDTCAGGELNVLRFAIPKDFIKEPSLEKIEILGDTYLKIIQFLKKDKKNFVDKLPQNFELIGLISVCLPGAKIINMRRDLWDVAISQFQQYYVKNVPYTSSFFSIAITAANFEYMLEVYSKTVSKEVLLQINYEDLVANQDQMITKIYSFCGIDSKYKSDDRSKHISNTASSAQVKEGIHQRSLKKNNFSEQKVQFWDTYKMQKTFWDSKDIEK